MQKPIEMVEKFMHLTNDQRDVEGAVGLMADNVKFDGPAAHCDNKQEYREMLSRFMPMHRGWKKRQVFENGSDVRFIDDISLEPPQGEMLTLEMSEWFTVTNGKIKAHRIFYDPAALKEAFNLH